MNNKISLTPQGSLIDETGTPYGVKHVGNKPRVINTPYLFAVAEGGIAGHQAMMGFGSRKSVQEVATGSDIWSGTATTVPIPDSAGEQLSLVSTSVNDTSAGTGARSIMVHYLDGSGLTQTETISLNGTTAVNMVATDVSFVQYIHTMMAGTSGVTEGTIIIYKTGSPTTIYNQIEIGGNMSLNTARKVPSDKTFYLTDMYITSADSKVAEIRLRITASHGVLTDGIFLFHGTWFLFNDTFNSALSIPIKCPAGSLIKLTAWIPTGKDGAFISAGYDGWVE